MGESQSVRGRILGTQWVQGWHVCILIDATVCVCVCVCVGGWGGWGGGCVCVFVFMCMYACVGVWWVHVCVWVHMDVHFKRSVFLGI